MDLRSPMSGRWKICTKMYGKRRRDDQVSIITSNRLTPLIDTSLPHHRFQDCIDSFIKILYRTTISNHRCLQRLSYNCFKFNTLPLSFYRYAYSRLTKDRSPSLGPVRLYCQNDFVERLWAMTLLSLFLRPSSNNKCVWLSVVLGALSMLAKETGITVLLLNLALDFYRCWHFVKRLVTKRLINFSEYYFTKKFFQLY